MLKYFLAALMLLLNVCLYSQEDNIIYFHKPFAINRSQGQVIIAGSVNNYIYLDYYGKDVKKETYTDPHSKPEYLIYELFKDMKNKNIAGIGKLYDTSFHEANFDPNKMADMLKVYTDIKYLSKFKSGDFMVVRYDFISLHSKYPYFATIRRTGDKYYLTTDINLSDPFNVIGSFSPYNLFERTEEAVDTKNMTAFYFVNKDNKVFFTKDLPKEDYAAVYLALESFDNTSSSPELDFLKQLQQAAQSGDSTKMKGLIVTNDLPLLAHPYFSSYYYDEIQKIFGNYPQIQALAGIKTSDGKILYFKYSDVGQSANIASVLVKQSQGKYFLSLRITDNHINNILENIYIREAIYDYLKPAQ